MSRWTNSQTLRKNYKSYDYGYIENVLLNDRIIEIMKFLKGFLKQRKITLLDEELTFHNNIFLFNVKIFYNSSGFFPPFKANNENMFRVITFKVNSIRKQHILILKKKRVSLYLKNYFDAFRTFRYNKVIFNENSFINKTALIFKEYSLNQNYNFKLKILKTKVLEIFFENFFIKFFHIRSTIKLNFLDFVSLGEKYFIYEILNRFDIRHYYAIRNYDSINLYTKIALFAVMFKSPSLGNFAITKLMRETKRHKKTLFFIKDFFKLLLDRYPTCSVRLEIFGKFNGRLRAKKLKIATGVPFCVQTFDNYVKFDLTHCFTYTGVFGIKFWLYV